MSLKLIIIILAIYSVLVTLLFLKIRSMLSEYIKVTNDQISRAMGSVEQSKQHEIDQLESKIERALNKVYEMKSKADCGHLKKEAEDVVYGFGYELHEILRDRQ